MQNGEQWDVPAEIIIINRAHHYAEVDSKDDPTVYKKVYEEEYNNAFSDNDLIVEWARNNYNWSDVESVAFKAAPPPRLTQKQKEEAWNRGPMTVVSRV
jgi:hypothetical protein